MTIAETSRKYGLTADTLRYYERIGIIPPVPRTRGGIRDYDEESCRWIELMKCLRSAGVQIEALIEYAALCQQGEGTEERRKAILMEQRQQLSERIEEIRKSLDRLDYKIANYEKILRKKEQECTSIASTVSS
jgi:DNA-binding transcriptional MerR regulator